MKGYESHNWSLNTVCAYGYTRHAFLCLEKEYSVVFRSWKVVISNGKVNSRNVFPVSILAEISQKRKTQT